MKLYLVCCKGMQSGLGSSTAYGRSFVAAENPDIAYKKVREALNRRDLGFQAEREMLTIELVGEAADYPDCGTIYYP